jgi:nonsense-mediated mRNA decay protein 3
LETEESGGQKGTETKAEKEYEEFMRDLEEDPELRSGVLMYKAPGKDTTNNNVDNESMTDVDEKDPDFADVTVDELVDDVASMAIDEEKLDE